MILQRLKSLFHGSAGLKGTLLGCRNITFHSRRIQGDGVIDIAYPTILFFLPFLCARGQPAWFWIIHRSYTIAEPIINGVRLDLNTKTTKPMGFSSLILKSSRGQSCWFTSIPDSNPVTPALLFPILKKNRKQTTFLWPILYWPSSFLIIGSRGQPTWFWIVHGFKGSASLIFEISWCGVSSAPFLYWFLNERGWCSWCDILYRSFSGIGGLHVYNE